MWGDYGGTEPFQNPTEIGSLPTVCVLDGSLFVVSVVVYGHLCCGFSMLLSLLYVLSWLLALVLQLLLLLLLLL